MMIQDIEPHQLRNQYHPEIRPDEADLVLCFRGSLLAVDTADGLCFPTARSMPEEIRGCLIYLFSVDDERYFLCMDEHFVAEGYPFTDLREIREQSPAPKHRLFAAFTGKHLADWYRDTRFCGRCGQPMAHSRKERAMVCSACGYTAYPRIMPAVIVGVIDGDRLMLTQYKRGYAHNALIAGFTEIGQTVEQTVQRQVMEEVGLRVKNVRYYKSQPWGTANDLLLGFYCDTDGSNEIRMDQDELKQAVWTARQDIILQPDSISLTNEMMERFKNGEEC